MSYKTTSWTKGDVISAAKLNNIEAGIASIDATTRESSFKLSALELALNSISGKVNSLLTNIQTTVTLSDEVTSVQKPNEFVCLTAGATITTPTTVVAKSVLADNLVLESTKMSIIASDSVEFNNVTAQGTLAKATSNVAFSINNSGDVIISNCDFSQSGYNCIEIGLSASVTPKNVLISNCEFGSSLANNAILVFAQQDGATITISNCHFADVSNVLRISNRTNTKATFNFVNCTIDKWDAHADYAGLFILEDYTTAANSQRELNLFSPEKITINISNCTGPNGKLIETLPSDQFCCKDADKQIGYISWDNGNATDGNLPAYDATIFPVVNFN